MGKYTGLNQTDIDKLKSQGGTPISSKLIFTGESLNSAEDVTLFDAMNINWKGYKMYDENFSYSGDVLSYIETQLDTKASTTTLDNFRGSLKRVNQVTLYNVTDDDEYPQTITAALDYEVGIFVDDTLDGKTLGWRFDKSNCAEGNRLWMASMTYTETCDTSGVWATGKYSDMTSYVPLIGERGLDGGSGISIDLSNHVMQVAVNSNGLIKDNQSTFTYITMFAGASKISTDDYSISINNDAAYAPFNIPETTIDEDYTYGYKLTNYADSYLYEWKFNGNFDANDNGKPDDTFFNNDLESWDVPEDGIKLPITITYNDVNIVKELSFQGSHYGEDGADAELYEMSCAYSTIHYNSIDDTPNYSPIEIKYEIKHVVGNTVNEILSLAEANSSELLNNGASFYYKVDYVNYDQTAIDIITNGNGIGSMFAPPSETLDISNTGLYTSTGEGINIANNESTSLSTTPIEDENGDVTMVVVGEISSQNDSKSIIELLDGLYDCIAPLNDIDDSISTNSSITTIMSAMDTYLSGKTQEEIEEEFDAECVSKGYDALTQIYTLNNNTVSVNSGYETIYTTKNINGNHNDTIVTPVSHEEFAGDNLEFNEILIRKLDELYTTEIAADAADHGPLHAPRQGNSAINNIPSGYIKLTNPQGTVTDTLYIDNIIKYRTNYPQEISVPKKQILGIGVILVYNDSTLWDQDYLEVVFDGVNGTDSYADEFIYHHSESMINWSQSQGDKDPSTWYNAANAHNYTDPDYIKEGQDNNWYDHPQGVDMTYLYEYTSHRTWNDLGYWNPYQSPVLWSKYGETGLDGDGVEYIYYRNNANVISSEVTKPQTWYNNPNYQNTEYYISPWTDNPKGVDENNQYEWVSIRKYTNIDNNVINNDILKTLLGTAWNDETYIYDILNTTLDDMRNLLVAEFELSQGEYDILGILYNLYTGSDAFVANELNDIDVLEQSFINTCISQSGHDDSQDIDSYEEYFNQIKQTARFIFNTSIYNITCDTDLYNDNQYWVNINIIAKNEKIWHPYSVPTIWSRYGKDGVVTDITLDSDNDMMAVAVDINNDEYIVKNTSYLSANMFMYYNTQLQDNWSLEVKSTNLSYSYIGNSYIGFNEWVNQDKRITYNIGGLGNDLQRLVEFTIPENLSIPSNGMRITTEASKTIAENLAKRMFTFNIIGLNIPTIYQLNVKPNAIKRTNGNLSTSQLLLSLTSVGCVGDYQELTNNLPNNFKLLKEVSMVRNEMSTITSSLIDSSPLQTTISDGNNGWLLKYITIKLYYGSDSIIINANNNPVLGNNILVDQETIYVVSDGAKGDKGDPGDPGHDAYSLYWSNDQVNFAVDSQGNNVSGNQVKQDITTLYCDNYTFNSIAVEDGWSSKYSIITPTISSGQKSVVISITFKASQNIPEAGDNIKFNVTLSNGATVQKTLRICGQHTAQDGVDGQPAITYELYSGGVNEIYINNVGIVTPQTMTFSYVMYNGNEQIIAGPDGESIPNIYINHKHYYPFAYLCSNESTANDVLTWKYEYNLSSNILSNYTYIDYRLAYHQWKPDILHWDDYLDREIIPIKRASEAPQGFTGPIVRFAGLWNDTSYYCGGVTNSDYDGTSPIYKDIVLYEGHYYTPYHTSWYYWKNESWASGAIGTGYINKNHIPTDSNYWTAATQFDFVATRLLYADQALINQISSHDFIATNQDGYPVAGITTSYKGDENNPNDPQTLLTGYGGTPTDSDSSVRIFAGEIWNGSSYSLTYAPFNVRQDGTTYMSKANIVGDVNIGGRVNIGGNVNIGGDNVNIYGDLKAKSLTLNSSSTFFYNTDVTLPPFNIDENKVIYIMLYLNNSDGLGTYVTSDSSSYLWMASNNGLTTTTYPGESILLNDKKLYTLYSGYGDNPLVEGEQMQKFWIITQSDLFIKPSETIVFPGSIWVDVIISVNKFNVNIENNRNINDAYDYQIAHVSIEISNIPNINYNYTIGNESKTYKRTEEIYIEFEFDFEHTYQYRSYEPGFSAKPNLIQKTFYTSVQNWSPNSNTNTVNTNSVDLGPDIHEDLTSGKYNIIVSPDPKESGAETMLENTLSVKKFKVKYEYS